MAIHTRQISTMEVEARGSDQDVAPADVRSTAAAALDQAYAYCAQKMRLSGPQGVLDQLRLENGAARGYFQHGLAAEVARRLAQLDGELTTVYWYDDEATADDEVFGTATPTAPLHLLLHVHRKTQALSSLLSALDCALIENFGTALASPRLTHLLDVQIVDDREVKAGAGAAALLSSVHHRPVTVWTR
jgi:hypothetical protein